MFGMRAAFELFQVSVAFVLQLLVNADLRGVITVNRHVLDRLEEFLFRRRWLRFVFADFSQQSDLLVF